ncbi:hypothetical protein NPA07_04395 [Mycoplasmopsis caviae]|uniref:Uncharacterized protein n=1 Tax=Mycoplasmopsis caviae TaxID=55603 RepID=A0A3P8L7F2_9BACT|nr:hypothetical protein [Mycoplasmopsis caviae]UUD35018.1 hypothetical protein NPA07_04395 [Mycoplasmopsis caviae]VDR42155.1 Uncharacterised protein [Mycoplasmopsis caviae]
MKKKYKRILTFSLITASIGIGTLFNAISLKKYTNNKKSVINIYDTSNNFLGSKKIKSGSSLQELIESKEIESISAIDKQLKNGKKIDYSYITTKKGNNFIEKDFKFKGKNEISIKFLNTDDISLKQNFTFNIPTAEDHLIENYSKSLKQIVKNLLNESNLSNDYKIFVSTNKQIAQTQIKLTVINFLVNKNWLNNYLIQGTTNRFKTNEILNALMIKKNIVPNISSATDISYLNFEIIKTQESLFDNSASFKENENIIDINLEYDLCSIVDFYHYKDSIKDNKLFLTTKYSFKDFESFKNDYISGKFNNSIPGVSSKNNFRNLYYYKNNQIVNLNDTYYNNEQEITQKLEEFWKQNQFEKKILYTDNKFNWIELNIDGKKYHIKKDDVQGLRSIFENSVANQYYFSPFNNKVIFYENNDISFNEFKNSIINIDQVVLFKKEDWLENIKQVELVNTNDNKSAITDLEISNDLKKISNLNKLNKNELINQLNEIISNKHEVINNTFYSSDAIYKWDVIGCETVINNGNSKLKIFIQRKKHFVIKYNNVETYYYIKDGNSLSIDKDFILKHINRLDTKYKLNKVVSNNEENNSIVFKYTNNETNAKWITSNEDKNILIDSSTYMKNNLVTTISINVINDFKKYHIMDKQGFGHWISIPYYSKNNKNEEHSDFISADELNEVTKLLKSSGYTFYMNITTINKLLNSNFDKESLFTTQVISNHNFDNINDIISKFGITFIIDLNQNTVNVKELNIELMNLKSVNNTFWTILNVNREELIKENYKKLINELLNKEFNLKNESITNEKFTKFAKTLKEKIEKDKYHTLDEVNIIKRNFIFKYSDDISFSYNEYNNHHTLANEITKFLKYKGYSSLEKKSVFDWIENSMNPQISGNIVIKSFEDAKNELNL